MSDLVCNDWPNRRIWSTVEPRPPAFFFSFSQLLECILSFLVAFMIHRGCRIVLYLHVRSGKGNEFLMVLVEMPRRIGQALKLWQDLQRLSIHWKSSFSWVKWPLGGSVYICIPWYTSRVHIFSDTRRRFPISGRYSKRCIWMRSHSATSEAIG